MKNIFFLFFLIAASASSQVKLKSTYPVYINYPAYTIKANVLNSSEKIGVKESLTYYWYASNKIMNTQGGYDGKILMGPYTSFYLSGNLKEKGKFKKGVKNGEWITWFENGKINQIQNWRCGVQTGVDETFNEAGELTLRQHYKRGKLIGKEITFEKDTISNLRTYKNGKKIIKREKKQLLRFFQLNKKNKIQKETIVKESPETATIPKRENKFLKKIQFFFKRQPKADAANSNLQNKE